MVVSTVSEHPDEVGSWNSYAEQAPDATLYHMYNWRNVVQTTFGHATYYLAARSESGSVEGILPLVQLKSWAFGHMLVSMPFFNYGGICANTAVAREALLDAAVRLAADTNADFLELRHDAPWFTRLPTKTGKVAMTLTLPQSADALWKSFPAKLRNQVQKPQKEGLTAVIGHIDQLDAFYDVFSTNMRDLGTPVYPKAFFANILGTFPGRTWIVTILLDRLPIAAGFLVGFRDRIEIPWASSKRKFNRYSANMLLYWRCLQLACDRNYHLFDFGRSTPGEGTFRFKEQWGATPRQLYWSYWMRNGGPMPQVNPQNPRYRAAINVWQRLPVAVTRELGPRIVKYIP
jgi:FemAB-related protein (PEP-CTERM system-associated)